MSTAKTISLSDIGKAVLAMESFVSAMNLLSQSLLRAGKAVHESFFAAYLKAGAPYGETEEGFIQWLESLKDAGNDPTERQ